MRQPWPGLGTHWRDSSGWSIRSVARHAVRRRPGRWAGLSLARESAESACGAANVDTIRESRRPVSAANSGTANPVASLSGTVAEPGTVASSVGAALGAPVVGPVGPGTTPPRLRRADAVALFHVEHARDSGSITDFPATRTPRRPGPSRRRCCRSDGLRCRHTPKGGPVAATSRRRGTGVFPAVVARDAKRSPTVLLPWPDLNRQDGDASPDRGCGSVATPRPSGRRMGCPMAVCPRGPRQSFWSPSRASHRRRLRFAHSDRVGLGATERCGVRPASEGRHRASAERSAIASASGGLHEALGGATDALRAPGGSTFERRSLLARNGGTPPRVRRPRMPGRLTRRQPGQRDADERCSGCAASCGGRFCGAAAAAAALGVVTCPGWATGVRPTAGLCDGVLEA